MSAESAATCRVDAWALTRAISPRPAVRVATVEAGGTVLNSFPVHQRLDQDGPGLPWAVYLAGADQRFRLLVFDLDAKADPSPAHRDADAIAGLLDDIGIGHVVCRSGPSGGRHVWVALQASVDAATVATMARLARHLCPSLDLAPLSNPVTGCVRPPGAPHRDGGTSQVLRGDLGTLTAPSTTPEQVRALVTRLAQLVDDTDTELGPGSDRTARTPLPVDRHGHLYLPGGRRPLPAVSAAALQTGTFVDGSVVGDASAVAWTVLIGAASARWRHDDVAALVPTAPGLEHVRSLRQGSTRVPRPARGPASAAVVLRRQWHKAVQHVATTARQVGADPTFEHRADAITAAVRAVQERADATAGRWGTRTGPTDRRVLDVLCVLALQAISADVEADTRRVALLAGIGRETARTGLLRLAAQGWIALSQAATGPHGARWTITPRATPPIKSSDSVSPATAPLAAVPPGAVHRGVTTDRSQADPRPAGAGPAERLALLAELTARTTDAAHDAFTTRSGLGHLAGNIWARLSHSMGAVDLARTAGHPVEELRVVLGQLADARLLERAGDTWSRPGQDYRDAVAAARGVAGVLFERERRYRVERAAWAWWQAEHAWMLAPRRASPARRAGTGQLDLLAEPGTTTLGAHPRRPDGRADFRAARAIVAAAGTTDPSPASNPQQTAHVPRRRRAA